MNRNRIAVIVAVALVALGVGVAVVHTGGSTTNRATAAEPSATTDTVSVSGTGSVAGVPDTLVANLRVHASNLSTVAAALNAAATDAHAVVDKLRAKGLAPADIKTADISLDQHYDNNGGVTGYDAGETLTISIHPLDHVSGILTGATRSGNNSVSLEGLSFDISDKTKLFSDARTAAFDNAKAAAAQYAELGGTTLDHVVSIKAVVRNASPTYGYPSAAGAGLTSTDRAAAIPIRPGQKKVSVTVNVVWALGN
jgi:uncharacterized protein YggE